MSEGKEKRRQQRTCQSILGQVWEKMEVNGRGQMKTAEDKEQKTESGRDRDRRRTEEDILGLWTQIMLTKDTWRQKKLRKEKLRAADENRGHSGTKEERK